MFMQSVILTFNKPGSNKA